MQAFVANLTAAALFIHTILGCCWHHAHHGTRHVAAVAKSATGCHHQEHSDGNCQQEKPCQCKVECEGTCIYVGPQKVKVEVPQGIAIDVLAVLPSHADRQIEAAASWQAGWSLPDLGPPLRTHLLH